MARRRRAGALTQRLGAQAAHGAEQRRAIDSAQANKLKPGFSTFPKPKFAIPPVPPGSYDPGLDAAERSTQRGFGDLRADYVRDYGETGSGGRAFNDYTLGVEDITRQVQQGRQDFDTQRGDIRLGYTRLGRKQGESARAHGILSAGLAALSAQKRNTNQGSDIGRVDTTEDRAFGLDRTQIGGEAGRQVGRLGLAYQRDTTDAGTGLERAGRENTQFSVDTDAARRYQAQVNGMLPLTPRRRRKAKRLR